MNFWANLIGYQLVWFCTVIGAGHGMAWPGLAALVLFAAGQITVSDRRDAEWRLMVAAVLVGALLDGTLSGTGLLRYAAPWPALPPGGAPLWILSLWAAFALTLRHSLRVVQGRPWLAVPLGAAGAPLAYAAAARGWSAVAFAQPRWHALAAIAAGWAVALPLLATLARRWSSAPATTEQTA